MVSYYSILLICLATTLALDTTKVEPVGDLGACDPEMRPRIITEPGTFQTPSYPEPYPSNSWCEWILRTDPVHQNWAAVDFIRWNMETSAGCEKDYAEFYDGEDDTGEYLGIYCSRFGPPTILTALSGSLFVRFVSDNATEEAPGFLGTFSVHDPSCTQDQPKILTSPTGIVSSPNYPENYPHAQDCSWHISAAPGEIVALNITSLELEVTCCTCDYLGVFDGDSVAAPLIGLYCASAGVPPLFSTGNNMFLRFTTDTSVSNSGFTGNYEIISDT